MRSLQIDTLWRRTGLLAAAAVVILCLGTMPAGAGVYDDELKKYEFDIHIRTLAIVNAALDPAAHAKALRLRLPVLPVVKTPESVEQELSHLLGKSIEEHHPTSRYRDIKEEAERLYKMMKVGDIVTIEMQIRDEELVLHGRLEAISVGHLKIKGVRISKRDVLAKYVPLLWWAEHERGVNRYIRIQTKNFNDARQKFEGKEKARLDRVTWPKYNYIKRPNATRWTPALEFFQERYAQARQALYDEHEGTVREAVYTENEWVYINDPNGVGEWVPKDQEQSFLDKLKAKVQGDDDEDDDDDLDF